jgi:hypothetical protein
MDDDSCKPEKPFRPVYPDGLELAQAYIPYQEYTKSYCPEEALAKGTMFPELYRPYDGRGKMCR